MTMAAGLAVTIGMGSAGAEEISSGNIAGKAMSFTRTVSGDALLGGTVQVGKRIQITNTITRDDEGTGRTWGLYEATDYHPECLEPVPGTSIWTADGEAFSNNGVDGEQKPDEVTSGPDWVKINRSPSGSAWAAVPLTWTQTYTVACEPGDVNTGGLNWHSTGGGDDKRDVGPIITVIAADPDDGGAGSLGSLAGMFGSLGSLGSFGSLS